MGAALAGLSAKNPACNPDTDGGVGHSTPTTALPHSALATTLYTLLHRTTLHRAFSRLTREGESSDYLEFYEAAQDNQGLYNKSRFKFLKAVKPYTTTVPAHNPFAQFNDTCDMKGGQSC